MVRPGLILAIAILMLCWAVIIQYYAIEDLKRTQHEIIENIRLQQKTDSLQDAYYEIKFKLIEHGN